MDCKISHGTFSKQRRKLVIQNHETGKLHLMLCHNFCPLFSVETKRDQYNSTLNVFIKLDLMCSFYSLIGHFSHSLSMFPCSLQGKYFMSAIVFLLHLFIFCLMSRSLCLLQQPQTVFEGVHI